MGVYLEMEELRNAFQGVKANRGCAGADGVTLEVFERGLDANLSELRHEIDTGAYRPLPLLRILVAKKNGEARALCIPCVRDRVAQKAVLQRITPVLEKEFEDCSFAYRKGRSIRQVVYRIQALYRQGFRWVVDADIDAFFDSVEHDLLTEKLRGVIKSKAIVALLEGWIKAEVWDGKDVTVLEKGIPQGSAVSPILANLFLDELDEAMLARGYQYVRYADDFIILSKTREQAREGLELSKAVLEKLDLELDEEEITSFEKGFKYLGVYFLNSLIMKPFECQEKPGGILSFPPPLNMDAYRLQRDRGW